MTMNERAWRVADELAANAGRFRVAVSHVAGVRVIDCGGAVTGGLGAGVLLARACLADLADVTLVPGDNGLSVQVTTDDPVRACLGSQYAGWQVKADQFFAMGSGPMRALAAREEVITELGLKEEAAYAVGCLETEQAPDRGGGRRRRKQAAGRGGETHTPRRPGIEHSRHAASGRPERGDGLAQACTN